MGSGTQPAAKGADRRRFRSRAATLGETQSPYVPFVIGPRTGSPHPSRGGSAARTLYVSRRTSSTAATTTENAMYARKTASPPAGERLCELCVSWKIDRPALFGIHG